MNFSEQPIWSPSPERSSASLVEQFRRHLNEIEGVELADTRSLHRYSCDNSGAFWRRLWDFAGVIGETGPTDRHPSDFAESEFFPDGTIDVAATMLAGDPADIVVIGCAEVGASERVDRGALRQRVSSLVATLRSFGVVEGDVVAGYATTTEQTLTMMLAVAACGAVYTTTSAEFGVDSVVDRFAQVSPKVLFAIDRYRFAGRQYDVAERVDEIVAAVHSIEVVVTTGSAVPDRFRHTGQAERQVTVVAYDVAVSDTEVALTTTAVAFNAPGWILYSSGTTGKPKCIVHRAGGVLLKHLSEMLLHCDIRRRDRVFYYTTPSWMMWNWLVSGLAAGACLVLYDGAPRPIRLSS